MIREDSDMHLVGLPTVFIVDGDQAFAVTVSRLVQSMQLNHAVFESAEELLKRFASFGHACIVLEIELPGISSLDLQRLLKENGGPVPPVIISTEFADVPSTVEAFLQGAITLVEKPFEANRLRREIEIALAYSAEQIHVNKKRDAAQDVLSRLTQREADVLRFLVLGDSNKLIAERLGLSIRAIEDRRRRILDKMDVRSLAEVVTICWESQHGYQKSPVGFRREFLEGQSP
jgi:FixJ family two-component response regulator